MTSDMIEDFGPKLPFSIIGCSGEDEAFPVTELLRHTVRTRGWQSPKMCEFPQEIIFRFDGDVDLRCIRILSHESKVSMKIDVLVARSDSAPESGVGAHPSAAALPISSGFFPDVDRLQFSRLGFMSFATNEETQFNARELKTARIRARACFVKLVLRKCHLNSINVFNQVGVVAIAFHGDLVNPLRVNPASPSSGGNFLPGADHLPGSARSVMNNRIGMLDDEVPLDSLTPQQPPAVGSDVQPSSSTGNAEDAVAAAALDPLTAKRIKDLLLHKARAVAEEDYDLAKVLKEQIEQLRSVGTKIAELEERKRVAVEQEDYDVAKALKRQIDELRNPSAAPINAAQRTGAVHHPAANNAPARGQSFHQQQAVHHGEQHHGDGGQSGAPPAAATSHDDQPVGGANRQRAVPHDEQPVGGGAATGSPLAPQPPAGHPSAGARGAAVPPVSHDEKPAVARQANNLDDVIKNSETGGIVVTSKPSAPTASSGAAVVSSANMPVWERTVNEHLMKLAGEDTPADALAAPKLAEYQLYTNCFGTYVTSCLFSKRWQLRDAAIRCIVSREGFEALTSGVRPPGQGSPQAIFTTLLQYVNGKTTGVADTIANVFFASSDALRVIAREELEGAPPANSLTSAFGPILPDLIAKAGDNNQRIREHAAATLMIIALSTIGCERVAHAAYQEPEPAAPAAAAAAGSGAAAAATKVKPVNPRVHLARLTTVQSLLEKIGLNRRDNRSGLTVDAIMSRLCIPLVAHPNSEVREAAVHLVVTLHGLAPQAVDKLLLEVKPAQRAIIDEQLQAGGGGGPAASEEPTVGGAAKGGRSKEMEMASSSVTVERGGNVAQAAAQAARQGEKGGAATGKTAAAAPGKGGKPAATGAGTAGGAAAAPVPTAADKNDPSKTCQFCGRFDKRFNDRTLDLHYAHSCPMLGPCYLCGQIAELALMQEHLVRDCERAHLVRQCPHCREAVRKEDYEVHVQAKACIAANAAQYNVCPLCHLKLSPGDRGWEEHFLKAPGCRNNPRRFDADPIPPM